MMRFASSCLAACACIALIAVGRTSGATYATWTAAAGGGPQAFASAHIFPATRTSVPMAIADNTNGGAETNTTDPYAVAGDGLTATTSGSWPTTFSPTRYLQFGYAFPGYAGPLPAGVAASAAIFDFTLTSPGAATTTFQVETRSIATGTVLGTHTSASYTVTSGTASFAIALPEVTTLDIASDLAVRVYEANSGMTTTTDQATVVVTSAVTSPATTWTTYPMSVTDSSTGAPTTTPWSLVALDGTVYTAATNWPTSFNTADYMRWQFPATMVPAGAIVTGATLIHSSKDNNGVKFCYYFDVDTSAGATTATHGSSATPFCNTTTSFVTDVVSLPELTTAVNANALALLNGMQLKMYGIDTTGSRKSQHDELRLQLTWYLP